VPRSSCRTNARRSRGDGVIGTLNTFGPDPCNTLPTKTEGFEPEAFTLYSYGAVPAIAAAANAAGSNDPELVARALKERGPFKTVLGDLAFDEKGDPKFPGYVICEWKMGPDGKITYFRQ
jgi:branched-chain amino acid transport system substrate-binding protein